MLGFFSDRSKMILLATERVAVVLTPKDGHFRVLREPVLDSKWKKVILVTCWYHI